MKISADIFATIGINTNMLKIATNHASFILTPE